MLQSGFLLPILVASVVVIEGTWFYNSSTYRFHSTKAQRRHQQRVFALRALIVTSLIAAVLTKKVSFSFLPGMFEGLFLTAIMMIPIIIYLIIREIIATSRNSSRSARVGSRANGKAPEQVNSTSLSAHTVNAAPVARNPAQLTNGVSTGTLRPRQLTSQQSVDKQAFDEYDDSGLDQTLNFDHTLSVNQQLQNIDGSVNHLDIGLEELPVTEHEPMQSLFVESELSEALLAAKTDKSVPVLNNNTLGTNNLPATLQAEAKAIITDLQKDKLKLQKLVIAQKAVIESEKRSHEKSRIMTKDAVAIMRRAREGQKIAEKIARRERTERRRLQADNEKIREQLENAISIYSDRTA